MAASIPAVPASFKPLQHHIKTAAEHDARDPVVAYYCKSFSFIIIIIVERKQAYKASIST